MRRLKMIAPGVALLAALGGCSRTAASEAPPPTASAAPISQEPTPRTTDLAPTGGQGSTTSAVPMATPEPTRTTPKPRGSAIIRWITQFTPAGGHGTRAEAAYVSFMQGRCWDTLSFARDPLQDESDELMDEPQRTLFEGAAAACLAAFHGRSNLWDTARSQLAKLSAAELGCWDNSVLTILRGLVEAHRANPHAEFVRGKSQSACPVLTGTHPDHGPRAGGYEIEIQGRNLPRSLQLRWGEQVITARRAETRGPLKLIVPAAEPDVDVLIVVLVVGAYRGAAGAANFYYDE